VSSWWWCGAEQEGSGGDAYVQQRDGGDFMGPTWVWPGQMGLVCPCCCVRSAPAVGGGGCPPGGCAAAAPRFRLSDLFRLTGHVMDLLHEREFADAGAAAPEGGLHGRLDGGRRDSGDGRLLVP
jgi:hypothetical protein